jgi:hypothetical protein
MIYITPGLPWENGYGESFNGKFRDECLDWETFLSMAEARIGLEWYRRHYYVERTHSTIHPTLIRKSESQSWWTSKRGAIHGQAANVPSCQSKDQGEILAIMWYTLSLPCGVSEKLPFSGSNIFYTIVDGATFNLLLAFPEWERIIAWKSRYWMLIPKHWTFC